MGGSDRHVLLLGTVQGTVWPLEALSCQRARIPAQLMPSLHRAVSSISVGQWRASCVPVMESEAALP
eukprot:scaffold1349_cov224-Prasinococcus_capsulatus_cf.AAC.1